MLSEPIAQSIRRHARETYPHECCGALIGVDGKATHVFALPNATDEGPRRRFRIRPEDYRHVEARADAEQKELLGFYHSHPDHPAYPSRYDLEHAFPFFSYVILAVEGGEPKDMRSFVLSEDRSEFLEEALQRGEP
jgi:proteasome lid subunit RPN8/RPN11